VGDAKHCVSTLECSFDYQLVVDLLKVKVLIMSVFHSVPGVPRGKMERFAGRFHAIKTIFFQYLL
jgi:hypothetical protein